MWYLEVCVHEVPLGMSPVIQATGRRIVHNWVWLHLMLTSAYWPKELDEKVAVLHFQVLGTELFFPVVTWISPGVASAGFTRHKKSELRAHQMARKFEVQGSPRTKIRAELSSNGSGCAICRFLLPESPRTGAHFGPSPQWFPFFRDAIFVSALPVVEMGSQSVLRDGFFRNKSSTP